MQQIILTLNLEMLQGICNMAMANRKDFDEVPLLIIRSDEGSEQSGAYCTLESIFDEDPNIRKSHPERVEYVDIDYSKGEPPIASIEIYKIEDQGEFNGP